MWHRLVFLVLPLLLPQAAVGHGGRTNADGCHTNRKTGDYHCHSKSAAPTPTRSAPSTVRFRNCTEARAAGVTPILRGQPGYAAHLDRDNDGIACE